MGEGQFFGTGVGNHTVVNGSLRSANPSRPGTASSSRASPYDQNTHALAALNMYDLANISYTRQANANSLKAAASDTNLRGSFSNGSTPNLRAPGPGFGSRTGTAGGGRAKAWVNPLDVHFGRTTASAGPSTPRSPLAQYEIGADDVGDNESVFGDKAENIAEAIMSSVAQKEREKGEKEREEKRRIEKERAEREARQRALEEEWMREEEWQKEQDRHRAAAAAAAIRSPHPGGPGYSPSTSSANWHPNAQMDHRPVWQGRHDQRPSSRNGRHNSPVPAEYPVFQGHGDYRPGSRNGSRPSPPLGPGPMNRGGFQGQVDYRPSSRNGPQDQRPRFQGPPDHQRPRSRTGPHDRPLFHGQMDQRPGSREGPQDRPVFQGQMDPRPGSRGGPHDRAHFQGQVDSRPGSRNGPQDRPVFQGQMEQRPGSRNGPRRDLTPPYGLPYGYPPNAQPNGYPNGQPNGYPNGQLDGYANGQPNSYPIGQANGRPVNDPSMSNGPGPVNGQGAMRGPGPVNGQSWSPNIGHTGHINGHVNGFRGSPLIGSTGGPDGAPRSPAFEGSPRSGSPMNEPARPSPISNNIQGERNGYYPAALPSPTASVPGSSDGNEMPAPADPADMPVTRDVFNRESRDTITSIIAKRASVSHAIDAFEKSLAAEESIRESAASSAYSVDEIISSPAEPAPAPAPAPLPSPPYANSQPQRTGSGAGRPFPGKNVKRPRASEYGVVPSGRVTPAAARAQSPPESVSPASPPFQQRLEHASLQVAPLFQQSKWDGADDHIRHEDFSAPRPAPTPTPITSDASSIIDRSGTPPTPDPSNPNWPLAPPPKSSPTAPLPPPQLTRPKPPPSPLDFNFSPDAFSRDPARFTPPVRMPSQRSPSSDTLRPAAPAAGEIGLARGLSIRRPDHGLRTPTGIADRFGTPLI